MRFRKSPMTREAAENTAIRALVFLSADEERLDRFLALTGMDAPGLRQAAAQPGFLAGVLDHLAADETALVAFAAREDLRPEAVMQAHALLSGGADAWAVGHGG